MPARETPIVILRFPEPGRPELFVRHQGVSMLLPVTRDQLKLMVAQGFDGLNRWPDEPR